MQKFQFRGFFNKISPDKKQKMSAVFFTAFLFFGIPTRVIADNFHYENFRFGQRALGMGGAVTAYPGEPESTLYNPAGLAFSGGTQFSGAINFFGSDKHTRMKSFGIPEPNQSAEDEVSNALPSFPSSSVFSKQMLNGNHVVALTTFQVVHRREHFSNYEILASPPDKTTEGIKSISHEASSTAYDRVLHIGGNYAWRLRPYIGIGITVVYARRDGNKFVRKNSVENYEKEYNGFYDVSTGNDISDGASFVRIGIQYGEPNGRWRIGFSCNTRSLHLHGQGKLLARFIQSGAPNDINKKPQFHTEEVAVDARTEYPFGFRIGALLRPFGGWALTFDLSHHAPIAYKRLAMDSFLKNAVVKSQALVRSQFNNDVAHESTYNVAVGAETHLCNRWPLRFGIFTNRSSAPPIGIAPQSMGGPHVDLYGATASIGHLSDKRSINFGTEIQWGQGHDFVTQHSMDILETPRFSRIDRRQLRVLFFVSGAVNFVKKSVRDAI